MLLLANPDEWLVRLKQTIVHWLPGPWQFVISSLITIAVLIAVFGALFAVATLIERKGLGRIQNRPGPNRVGPYGVLQPMADAVKMLIKEDVVPRAADRVVHFLAPLVLVAPVMLAFSVIPYGQGLVPINLDAGVLFFFAVGAASELAVFMAGWSGHNKYSLLGAMRAIAQMISYEIPLVLSTVTVVMMVGSLSLVQIVAAQGGYWWGVIPRWNIFAPWGLAGFVVFMIAAIAESNRSPFDLPEGESEIIAGFLTEYSGFKYAVFFMGEYFGMFAISGLAITLFLGGWHAPLPYLGWVPSFLWFFGKLFIFLFVFIWLRGTLPRLRMDQLMNYAWKCLLPLALINIGVAVIWRFTAGWPGPLRWLVCALLIVLAFVWLEKTWMKSRELKPRTYHYAS
ncbi:MAG: NADH-quinone oxidoreductase subunit NuoH [Candidatus Omnitrophica bacterium]|nr:NADH-quinone oxidoreductase subunit NuoH [Candidatus Omnitrophota bacterium]